MNTEINFLEKETKRMSIPLFLLLVFLLLLIAVAAVLLIQRGGLASAIDQEKATMTALEDQMAKLEEDTGHMQQLKQTKEALASIETRTVPRVALYKQMLGMLGDSGQLESFTYESGELFQLEVAFDSLSSVSDYTDKMLQQPYLLNVKLADVSKAGDGYDASFAVTIDADVLREEMSTDAD
ncbi:hypothetical protein GCM10008983_27120 [Lentibacillus halophilus]|uniref:Tfp pilus assembly protein PilN n=1 Tax=Lentibacillus halophilus TaxID=295065 RepID=A0ABP3JB97_9BACI